MFCLDIARKHQRINLKLKSWLMHVCMKPTVTNNGFNSKLSCVFRSNHALRWNVCGRGAVAKPCMAFLETGSLVFLPVLKFSSSSVQTGRRLGEPRSSNRLTKCGCQSCFAVHAKPPRANKLDLLKLFSIPVHFAWSSRRASAFRLRGGVMLCYLNCFDPGRSDATYFWSIIEIMWFYKIFWFSNQKLLEIWL